MSSLSLDIGATNIRIAEVSVTKISNKQTFKTPKKKREILSLIFEIIKKQNSFSRLCVAVAGVEINEKIQNALNMDINGVALRKILERKFRVPVFLDNDARCSGLAELHYGSGKKYRNFILLTLGSGIGGAIIINKKVYRGTGTAGEIGSMYLDNKIYEKLASGKASLELAREQFQKNLTGKELNLLADKKNKTAISIYNEIGENLGRGMANLAFILAPEAIILGGGFSDVKHFWKSMIKTLHETYLLKIKIPIVKAKFRDDAGLIGAASLSTKSL